MIAAFFSKAWGWLAVVGGLIAAGLAAYFSGRSVGKAKQTESDAVQRINDHEATVVRQVIEERAANDTSKEAIKNANDANADVGRLDSHGLADELRKDYQREDGTTADGNAGGSK